MDDQQLYGKSFRKVSTFGGSGVEHITGTTAAFVKVFALVAAQI